MLGLRCVCAEYICFSSRARRTPSLCVHSRAHSYNHVTSRCCVHKKISALCIVCSCSGVQKMSVYDRYLCLIIWAIAPFGFIFVLGCDEGGGAFVTGACDVMSVLQVLLVWRPCLYSFTYRFERQYSKRVNGYRFRLRLHRTFRLSPFSLLIRIVVGD